MPRPRPGHRPSRATVRLQIREGVPPHWVVTSPSFFNSPDRPKSSQWRAVTTVRPPLRSRLGERQLGLNHGWAANRVTEGAIRQLAPYGWPSKSTRLENGAFRATESADMLAGAQPTAGPEAEHRKHPREGTPLGAQHHAEAGDDHTYPRIRGRIRRAASHSRTTPGRGSRRRGRVLGEPLVASIPIVTDRRCAHQHAGGSPRAGTAAASRRVPWTRLRGSGASAPPSSAPRWSRPPGGPRRPCPPAPLRRSRPPPGPSRSRARRAGGAAHEAPPRARRLERAHERRPTSPPRRSPPRVGGRRSRRRRSSPAGQCSWSSIPGAGRGDAPAASVAPAAVVQHDADDQQAGAEGGGEEEDHREARVAEDAEGGLAPASASPRRRSGPRGPCRWRCGWRSSAGRSSSSPRW